VVRHFGKLAWRPDGRATSSGMEHDVFPLIVPPRARDRAGDPTPCLPMAGWLQDGLAQGGCSGIRRYASTPGGSHSRQRVGAMPAIGTTFANQRARLGRIARSSVHSLMRGGKPTC